MQNEGPRDQWTSRSDDTPNALRVSCLSLNMQGRSLLCAGGVLALTASCFFISWFARLYTVQKFTWIPWPWEKGDTDKRFTYDPQKQKCREYSPAYPSTGGAGCSPKCNLTKGGQKTYSFSAIFFNSTHKWPKDLVENMHLAASILKKFGSPRTLDTEKKIYYLHVSFEYYCCYAKDEVLRIKQFLNSYVWKRHEVWFDKMVCAIHGYDDLVSFVLMVDEKSEKSLLQWALAHEHDLEVETGIRKHIPHTHLQGFHMTLGTVNQSEFPVRPALDEINKVITPGTWHKKPIILHKPLCKKCDKILPTANKEKKEN